MKLQGLLGTIAKKAVGKVIGWGASTIFGMDKDKVAENVYDTLEWNNVEIYA
jgi:hypothetical protein